MLTCLVLRAGLNQRQQLGVTGIKVLLLKNEVDVVLPWQQQVGLHLGGLWVGQASL